MSRAYSRGFRVRLSDRDEAVMLWEKRDGQASYTNAKCDKVNVKLDSPQSESDRGESQLNVARAA